MKFFHVGLTPEVVREYAKINGNEKLSLLVSFDSIDGSNDSFLFEDRVLVDEIMLDSGTYTLNRNPQKYKDKITFDGYCATLNSLAFKVTYFFNFDADYSQDGFVNNLLYQQELEEKRFNPVPVIHDCYNLREINYYIDNNYEMVAIGSAELSRTGIDELFMIVEKFWNKNIKVHLLGCMQFEKLVNTPVYSCDASTCARQGGMGYINFWNEKKQKTDAIDFVESRQNRYFYRDYKYQQELEGYLNKELGLKMEDLAGKENKLNRDLANIHYYVKLEKLITERHRQQGFI